MKHYGDLEEMLLPERIAEASAGRKEHLRWLQGYYGQVGEHYFLGRGEQGTMLRMSGALATTLFDRRCLQDMRCTRIDVQVTATPPIPVNDFLHEAYWRASIAEKSRGRPAEVELRDTNYGAKMLTIGSRQSSIYFRCYDKYRESNDEGYKNMVRLELEVKKPESGDLYTFLRQDELLNYHCKHILTQYCEKKGIPTFWRDYEDSEPPQAQKRHKTDETRLAWVKTQWLPTLKLLVKNGKSRELAMAMLPDDTDDATIDELAVLLALNCTD
jgi:DNA relaxase NicK